MIGEIPQACASARRSDGVLTKFFERPRACGKSFPTMRGESRSSKSLSNSTRPRVIYGEWRERPQDTSDARFMELNSAGPSTEPTHPMVEMSAAFFVALSRFLVIPVVPDAFDEEGDMLKDVESCSSSRYPEEFKFTLTFRCGSIASDPESEIDD